jgi:iodotyrosine deiodinase
MVKGENPIFLYRSFPTKVWEKETARRGAGPMNGEARLPLPQKEQLNIMPRLQRMEFKRLPAEEQLRSARQFLETMRLRRTVRMFSSDPVPFEIIENAIRVAGLAPSGANQQPWHFVVVTDPEIKHRIRLAAEEEERAFYRHRAPDEWLEALAPLGTDEHKPFLDAAPYLIVVFRQDYGIERDQNGHEQKKKHYYAMESVGIAVGMLLTALHLSGLATLTHTPSPMGFLTEILRRPKNEKPFLLIPVGYAAEDVTVPVISKKSLPEIMDVF